MLPLLLRSPWPPLKIVPFDIAKLCGLPPVPERMLPYSPETMAVSVSESSLIVENDVFAFLVQPDKYALYDPQTHSFTAQLLSCPLHTGQARRFRVFRLVGPAAVSRWTCLLCAQSDAHTFLFSGPVSAVCEFLFHLSDGSVVPLPERFLRETDLARKHLLAPSLQPELILWQADQLVRLNTSTWTQQVLPLQLERGNHSVSFSGNYAVVRQRNPTAIHSRRYCGSSVSLLDINSGQQISSWESAHTTASSLAIGHWLFSFDSGELLVVDMRLSKPLEMTLPLAGRLHHTMRAHLELSEHLQVHGDYLYVVVREENFRGDYLQISHIPSGRFLRLVKLPQCERGWVPPSQDRVLLLTSTGCLVSLLAQ
jgi:hypothetical protein